jgi:hypothetical protein
MPKIRLKIKVDFA